MTKTESIPCPTVIASRRTCDAEGTGLSHYVLMDKQVKPGQAKSGQVTR